MHGLGMKFHKKAGLAAAMSRNPRAKLCKITSELVRCKSEYEYGESIPIARVCGITTSKERVDRGGVLRVVPHYSAGCWRVLGLRAANCIFIRLRVGGTNSRTIDDDFNGTIGTLFCRCRCVRVFGDREGGCAAYGSHRTCVSYSLPRVVPRIGWFSRPAWSAGCTTMLLPRAEVEQGESQRRLLQEGGQQLGLIDEVRRGG